MDISSARNSGGTSLNRDYIGMLEDGGVGCFAVCDGSPGSAETVDTAETVIDSFMDDFKATSDVTRETVAEYFRNADEKLWSISRDPNAGGEHRASAALVLTDGNIVISGHLGNCRMYYLSENFLQYITPDHSLAYKAHAEGKFRFPRIRKSHDRRKLTAYMGADPMCAADVIEPLAVHKGDAVLICTDGFWEKVTERQVERTLKRSRSSSEWLRRMLKIVKKRVPEDNYSAVTIIF